MKDYEVKIADSSHDLTARERLMYKDTSNAIRLDEATTKGTIVITPVAYAVLEIHNEKGDDKDYNNYVILDSVGNKYVTGSSSFWKAFEDIWDEMSGEDEPFEIEIYRLESKNYKGKQFITCSIH